jgi:hypothetical protein
VQFYKVFTDRLISETIEAVADGLLYAFCTNQFPSANQLLNFPIKQAASNRVIEF